RHRPEAVVDVVGSGLRQRAVAVAAQVREDHVIALGEPGGDAVPAGVILRIAVHEQQRRSRAAVPKADDGAAGANVEVLEPREMGSDLGAAPAGRIADVVLRRGDRHPVEAGARGIWLGHELSLRRAARTGWLRATSPRWYCSG